MKYHVLIVKVFLFNLFLNSLVCQGYLSGLKLLTTEDGLSALLTHGMYQDSKGYLWIGTKYGLDRYDGYNFTHYDKANNNLRHGNSDSRIIEIIEDDQGNLWLDITSQYEKTHDVFQPSTGKAVSLQQYLKGVLPLDEQVKLIRSPNCGGVVYLLTTTGTLYGYKDRQLMTIACDLHRVTDMEVDEDGHFWIASFNQLIHLASDGQILDTQVLNTDISDLSYYNHRNKTLLCISLDLTSNSQEYRHFSYTKAEQPQVKPLQFFDEQQVLIQPRQVTYTYFGLWIGRHNNHLAVFDSKGHWMYNLPFPFSIPRSDVFVLQYEHVGESVFISTIMGLLKIDFRQNFFKTIQTDSLSFDYRGITEDENGDIYFNNKDLFYWNQENDSLQRFDFRATYQIIYQDSVIWSSLYSNLTPARLGRELNLQSGAVTNYYADEGIYAFSKLATDDPHQFLIGHNKGVSFINLNHKMVIPFEQYNEFEILKTLSVFHLHRNATGIWLATSSGIFLLDEVEGIVRRFSQASGDLPFDHINHIHEDQLGRFWLSTGGGGLVRWEAGTNITSTASYAQWTVVDGLSHNFLYAAYGDEHSNLWVSSNKGLMRIDQQSMEIYTYDTQDGLPHNEFNTTSHYQAKDGTIYFGGIGGIVKFHPDDLSDAAVFNAPMYFTACQLLRDKDTEMTDHMSTLTATQEMTITPTDKLLEIAFTLLDYDEVENHRYAYQIEGYDNNWRIIEENFLRITHLPYGTYRLKIRGRNVKKGWSQQELELPIYVLKPFYLQWWFILLLGLITFTTILLVFRYRLQRLERDRLHLEREVKQRTKQIESQAEELQQLDKAKTRFFSNITHEFRTPLTLIIGPTEQLIENIPPSPILKRRLNGILKNAKHLLGLINQMLDLSKIEGNQIKVEITRGDIVLYTRQLAERFEPLAHKKSQQLDFISEHTNWETYFDEKKWNKIVYNLLHNALKFTPENGLIQLFLQPVNEQGCEFIQLKVRDSGIGIDSADLAHIFDRFYQIDNTSTRQQDGTGIGLALVKELVKLQGGEIQVSSTLKEGTVFEVILPVTKIDTPGILNGTVMEPFPLETLVPERTTTTTTGKGAQEKLELLIVEDNEEMREYIYQCVDTSKYHITEAINGEDGILKAKEIVPDLIISDVMMPKKDGFELVKEIRTHLITSHIPIILLTAKTSLESRLEGFKRGADAYLTKPFSPHELALRIQKLIELRQLLRSRYQDFQPLDKTEKFQQEDEFMSDLKTFITDNLNNPNLNVTHLCKHFGISRTQFYRKLNALVGRSVAEYIRSIRLEAAKQLLTKKQLTIAEIAYSTGFSSPSHFTRTFKKAYGKTPSSY